MSKESNARAKPTKFPVKWVLKKAAHDIIELQKENKALKKEIYELNHRLDNYSAIHEAKIAVRKEELYKSIKGQLNAFECRYAKVTKALSDIKKVAYNVSESSDGVAAIDDICQILIKYYENRSNKTDIMEGCS